MIIISSVLQATDLKKYYGTETNITKALDGITFSVAKGEFGAVGANKADKQKIQSNYRYDYP